VGELLPSQVPDYSMTSASKTREQVGPFDFKLHTVTLDPSVRRVERNPVKFATGAIYIG
jgi:hypothetical protein